MNILLIFLLIILIVSLFVNFNLFKRAEKFEELYINSIDDYEVSIELIENCIIHMNEIDSKGSFQSDDEVGVSFKLLKEAVDELSTNLTILNQNAYDKNTGSTN